MLSSQWPRFFGGVLLVAGTTIGAAMLALPVATGVAGYFPALLLFTLFWLYMLYTALLFVEVNSWVGEGSNLISMAHKVLGRGGKLFCWLGYLFLLYALMTAYIAGSSSILSDLISQLTGVCSLGISSALPLLLFIALLLLHGVRNIDYFNRVLMLLLAMSYFLLVALLVDDMEPNLLFHWGSTSSILLAMPIVATSFGYHIIIPSLYNYLQGDVPLLRRTLIVGSIIPLATYLLWETISLSIIPLEGEFGILTGWKEGKSGVQLLLPLLGDGWLASVASSFSFFAILTSVLGVSLGLFDFLGDGLKLNGSWSNDLLLLLLTFLPPLLITAWDPRSFLTALEYAGAFGVMLLLGLMPTLMVWRGRYRLGLKGAYRAPGGRPLLLLTGFVALLVCLIQLSHQLGLLQI